MCLLSAAVGLASSCTTKEAYHLHAPVVELPGGSASNGISGQDGVTLCHVELDDQRELFSHEQLKKVTNALTRASAQEDLLVLVFFHGWNNNASGKNKQSGAMEAFKSTLIRLNKAQGLLKGRKPFGVLVSWRGKTLDVPFSHGLDYFHRNEAARRKGVAATEVVYDLGFTAKQSNPDNRVVMAGHSMGALMLESALSEGMGAEIVKRQRQGTVLDHTISPADLVLLLNPAESAGESKALISLMKNRGVHAASSGYKADLPLLVALSSRGDGATRATFKSAVWIGRMLPFSTASSGKLRTTYQPEEDHGSTQGKIWSRPVPHVAELNSHDGLQDPLRPWPGGLNAGATLDQVLSANLHPEHTAEGFHFETKEGRCNVRRTSGFNNTPYWVFRVPDNIIGSHGDIWNDNALGLMATLMRLRSPASAASVPKVPRDEGRPATSTLQMNLRAF